MVCTNCGASLQENAKFCGKCGTIVEQISAEPEPAKKKKGMPWYLTALIIVVVVAVLAVAAYLIFGMKTIYVVSEYTFSQSDYVKTTYQYDYDNRGRLKELTMRQTWDDYRIVANVTYQYKGNKIDSAELEFEYALGSESADVTYTYKNGKLDEVESDSVNGIKMEASCNKEGLIDHVVIYDNGEKGYEIQWTYHKNGHVKREEVYESDSVSYVNVYNEEDYCVKYEIYLNEELEWRYAWEYDEKGNVVKEQAVRSGWTVDGEKTSISTETEYHYTYDKNGDLEDMYTILVASDEKEIRTDYAVERHGDRTTVRALTENGDKGDIVAIYTKDENGNITEKIEYMNGLPYFTTKTEYEKIRVPRNYIEPMNDTKYLTRVLEYIF